MADSRTGAGKVPVRLDSFVASENKKCVQGHSFVTEPQECAAGDRPRTQGPARRGSCRPAGQSEHQNRTRTNWNLWTKTWACDQLRAYKRKAKRKISSSVEIPTNQCRINDHVRKHPTHHRSNNSGRIMTDAKISKWKLDEKEDIYVILKEFPMKSLLLTKGKGITFLTGVDTSSNQVIG